jgi:hypothetical protein
MEYQERATAFDIEQQCAYGDMIQEAADKKMRNEYEPADYHNFVEAIGEDALAKHWDTIKTAWNSGDKATVGLMITTAIYTYWENKAISEAEDEAML